MFFSRDKELSLIHKILSKPSGSAIIYGKRKVGKTTLITDFTNAVNVERIFYAISNGKKKYSEIENKLKMKNNGLLSKQLAALTSMDIISKTRVL